MTKRKKSYNYFQEFIKNAELSLECAKMVLDVTKDFKEDELEENKNKLHEIENLADISKHEMLNFLLKDFLPPIEREDIILLANRIDDVTDEIDDVLIKMDMYNIRKVKKETLEFVQLLVICCEKMVELLVEFENFKKSQKVIEKVVEINRLEEDGDKIYINTIKNLYKTCENPIELVIWTRIFEKLEKCFDACEQVANAVEEIVLKNS